MTSRLVACIGILVFVGLLGVVLYESARILRNRERGQYTPDEFFRRVWRIAMIGILGLCFVVCIAGYASFLATEESLFSVVESSQAAPP
jgi:hypothetical protein